MEQIECAPSHKIVLNYYDVAQIMAGSLMFLGGLLAGAASVKASGMGRLVLIAGAGIWIYLAILRIWVQRKLDISPHVSGVLIGFILLGFWAVARSSTLISAFDAIRYLMIASIFFAVQSLPIRRQVIRILSALAIATILLSLVLCKFGPKSTVIGWYAASNYPGAFFMLLLYYPLLMYRDPGSLGTWAKVGTWAAILGILVSLSRGPLVTLAVVGYIAAVKERLLSPRAFKIVTALGVLGLVLGITLFIYRNDPILEIISMIVAKKRIDTGRGELWALLLQRIILRPWTGWGTGVTPDILFGIELSAHNGFLQILLQFGIIGMSFVVASIYKTFQALHAPARKASQLAVYMFLALCLHDFIEVMLFQNQLPFFMSAWALLGLSLRADEPTILTQRPVVD